MKRMSPSTGLRCVHWTNQASLHSRTQQLCSITTVVLYYFSLITIHSPFHFDFGLF